jgi:hypothetical protein
MSDLKRLCERLAKRAELPARMRLYDATRHTFNSTAAYFGVPREIRMRLHVSEPGPGAQPPRLWYS